MGLVKAFYFDGVSSVSRGLVIEHKYILNGPEPDLQEYEIPGRDGTVYISNNRRKNVSVSYDTFLRVPRPDDIQPWITGVKGWLMAKPGQYFRLEDDYDLAHYRMASYVGGLEVENSWRIFTRQTVSFSCLPYRYLKSGEDFQEGSNDSVTVINPTSFESLPQIKVVHGMTFDKTMTLTIDYEDGTSYDGTVSGLATSLGAFIIDSSAQIIRDGPDPAGAELFPAEIGVFPVLKPGTNVITMQGSGLSSVSVAPLWREL